MTQLAAASLLGKSGLSPCSGPALPSPPREGSWSWLSNTAWCGRARPAVWTPPCCVLLSASPHQVSSVPKSLGVRCRGRGTRFPTPPGLCIQDPALCLLQPPIKLDWHVATPSHLHSTLACDWGGGGSILAGSILAGRGPPAHPTPTDTSGSPDWIFDHCLVSCSVS